MIKKLLRNIFGQFGYEIHKRRTGEVGFNSTYLSSVCNPDLVVDVGVGFGTHALYEAYPSADLILVEALTEYQDAIEPICNKYDAEVIYKGLGKEEGSLKISFDKNDLQKASFFERTKLTKNKGEVVSKTIEVTTLDALLSTRDISNKTVLLKIDVEGAELDVLKGGMRSLPHIDYVIIETSLAKRFEGSYEFEDLIKFMSDQGYHVYSFLTMPFPVKEPRQRFTDILFSRKPGESGL